MQRHLAPRAVQRGQQQRRRRRRAHQADGAGHGRGVDAPAVPDVEHRALGQRARDLVRAREHGVAALREPAGRQRLVEAEVRPPGLVDDQRHPRGMGHLGARRHVGRHPVVGGRDDEGRAGVRRGRERIAQRAGLDAVGHAQLGVVLGRDEGRYAAREHEPVDQRGVRVALGHHPRAERGQREAQRVVALRRAVGQKPRARGSMGLGGEALGLLVGGRRGPEVDAPDVLRDVEPQCPIAEAEAQPGVGALAALVPGDVEAPGTTGPVADHGVEVGRGRLLGHSWPAVRISSARTKPSRSPSSTRWASPTSNEVRWSLTIVYGCRT